MKFASASPKATRRIGPGIPPRTSEFQKPNRAAIAVTVVSSGRAFRGVLFGAGRAAQDPLPRHPEGGLDVHARGCGPQPRPPAEAAGCRGVTTSGPLSRDCRAAEFWQGRTAETTVSIQKHTATGQPSRETLEISEFFRSLLRSDTQAGPTRRCPPDGYDVSWMRVSQCNERWRTWEGSTARLQR
jgi:hypothetical protein